MPLGHTEAGPIPERVHPSVPIKGHGSLKKRHARTPIPAAGAIDLAPGPAGALERVGAARGLSGKL